MSDAIKLAIEALEVAIPACELQGDKPGQLRWHTISDQLTAAITALRTALEAKDVEPVAWVKFADNGNVRLWSANRTLTDEEVKAFQPVYTHPAAPDARLVEDAARYRWLREQHWSDSKFAVVSNPKTAVNLGSICPSRELLDEAIDAAIGETMV